MGSRSNKKKGKLVLEKKKKDLDVEVIKYNFQHCELCKLNSIHLNYIWRKKSQLEIQPKKKKKKISKYLNILLSCGWTI